MRSFHTDETTSHLVPNFTRAIYRLRKRNAGSFLIYSVWMAMEVHTTRGVQRMRYTLLLEQHSTNIGYALHFIRLYRNHWQIMTTHSSNMDKFLSVPQLITYNCINRANNIYWTNVEIRFSKNNTSHYACISCSTWVIICQNFKYIQMPYDLALALP